MSTAARPHSTQSGYGLARPTGVCAVSGRAIEPDEHFMAAMRETPEGFERVDVAMDHWAAFDRERAIAFWRTQMPRKDARKPLFVDDAILGELLVRLADVQEPAKVCFRFVLALILMRKRLVTYESTVHSDGHDVWRVRLKGHDRSLEIVDPKPTEEQIAAVSEQLGQILNDEA